MQFTTTENRDKVLKGHYVFDSKPLIVKPWQSDMNFDNKELKALSIWVQLGLGIMYWGEKTLYKIVDQIGKPLQRDEATKKRDKVRFVRVLVKVQLNQQFPKHIQFVNEHDEKKNYGGSS